MCRAAAGAARAEPAAEQSWRVTAARAGIEVRAKMELRREEDDREQHRKEADFTGTEHLYDRTELRPEGLRRSSYPLAGLAGAAESPLWYIQQFHVIGLPCGASKC
jgi:hypothetical protein